jgi:hypothetical protein
MKGGAGQKYLDLYRVNLNLQLVENLSRLTVLADRLSFMESRSEQPHTIALVSGK